ncbi:MAG: EAL domain-containing protein [Propionivibrio sp.]|uniref:EAL domain-containing protein n=1 Tax=Propionivibrio sp. TaxID=2212460 RepID=UPI0025FF3B44|nr:EAL domain-containing protein [Propionivibrio sp.]MBK8402448.1 EAL domain-containing protein [Propionivibrio sp.]MBK8892907.1 EAL domain-containing protein [Propionivibrio sp.]
MTRTTVVAGYNLTELLGSDDDWALWRGFGPDGEPALVLRAPSAAAAPKVLARLEHEYALRDRLNPEWAVCPTHLLRTSEHSLLISTDPGGQPLEQLCGQPLEIRQFLAVASELAAALASAHAAGLLHKDIKPANCLVDRATGRIHLTGFGFASRMTRQHQALHASEELVGTYAYMAPEQTGRMNRSVDSRADLYSLGVVLYKLLTGRLPFQASDPLEWVHCHIARTPPSIAEQVDGVPQAISSIVMKLLNKTAGERYQTAAGLAADLRHCLDAIAHSGSVAPFILGRHDAPDRLSIPEKLYGRAYESKALVDAFHRVVTTGAPELILVSGYSGIGKSSLVNELHKEMILPRSLFGSGKFDQLRRGTPYATLAQAFQGLVRKILICDKSEVARWAQAIQDAVGPNGQLVQRLIPDLEFLIGAQAPVPELSSNEARNRFHAVFQRFISVFATADHPLVLFLDDLQWLDPASLALLDHLITHPDTRHLLLIGAYRSNEVSATHPLILALESLRKSPIRIGEIALGPLSVDDLGQLIAEALACDAQCAANLSRLIHDKTDGNPFFSIQLLSSLYEERLLTFEADAESWRPNIDAIRAYRHSEDVVDLMIGKLGRLSPPTRSALGHLASLGNSAPCELLALVAGATRETLEADLDEALSMGFVHAHGSTLAFSHDRIQEAAYALIPEGSRPAEHLRIGRLLAARMGDTIDNDSVFDTVNQLNKGIDLLTAADERALVRRYNVCAGQQAKASTAYAAARSYFAQARALLPENAWEMSYDESYSILLALSECEYLTGDLDKADALFNELLENARLRHERARVIRLRMSLYQFAGRFVDAVDTVLAGLAIFGMSFPESDDDIAAAIQTEKNLVPTLLDGRRIAELIDAPRIEDPDIQAMLGILVDASPCVYIARPSLWPLILLKALNLSLRYGNAADTCGAYSAYSILLAGVFEDAPAAFAYSEMALALNERIANPRLRPVLLYRHGAFVSNSLQPFSDSEKFLQQAFVACLEVGNLVYAGLSAVALSWIGLDKGSPLVELSETARKYAAFAHDNGNTWAFHTARAVELFASGLIGDSADRERCAQETAEREACSIALAKGGFQVGIATFHILGQMTAFLEGRHEQALSAADSAAALLRSVMSMACEFAHHFYLALTLAALHDEAGQTLRLEYRKRLTEHLRKLSLWAAHCPRNFSARRALVAAEIARIDGETNEAMRLYEEALRVARDDGSALEEGLAYEIAARFWRHNGFDAFADVYLRNSRNCYMRWGALAKVAAIDRQHPGLEAAPAVTPTSSRCHLGDLDLVSVVKASQAVSSEVVPQRLIESLLTIVLELAGAQRGLLIMMHGEDRVVVAEATTLRERIEVAHRHDPLSADDLPVSILNFVFSTRQQALLDDASRNKEFSGDVYLRRSGARSVLCLPLVKQAKLVGALYLENSLATGAFTPERIALLELLASQAAISLENANLYAELEERVADRTRALTTEVAERSNAQSRLHLALTELELILDNASLGIVITVMSANGQRIIRQVNSALERMLGYAPGELKGNDTRIVFASDEDYHAIGKLYQTVLREGRPYVGEHVYRRKDGGTILAKLIGAAIDPGDLSRGIVFLVEDITERRTNETLLKATVRELEAFMHNSLVAIIFTRDRKITRYNPRFSAMFGYSGDDAIGQPAQILFPSQEAYEALGQKAFPLLSAAQPVHDELYMKRRDGQILWVNVIGYVANPDNAAEGTIWVLEDRTAFKQADDALRRSHAELEERVVHRTEELSQQLHFLQQLIEAIPGPVYYKDADSRYLGCNSAFAEFIGKPADELIGKTPSDIAFKELAAQHLASDRKILDHPGSLIYESPVRYATGEMRDVMFHKATFTRPDGTVGGIVGLMLDITDRKTMEDDLRQAATVFESAAESVIITESDCRIIAVNRAFTETTGYTMAEVVGRNPRLLQSGRHDTHFYRAMWESIEGNGRWQGELWNRRKSGEIYPEWISITAVHDTHGRLVSYVSTSSDITQQKKNEERIQVLAFTDPLTELPNRRLLLDRLQHAIATSYRNKRHGALFFIDLDDFKTLNDTLGHDIGDLLLRQVASRLTTCIRQGDTVARLGGDEFVVLLEDLSIDPIEAATQAEVVGKKIIAGLGRPYHFSSYICHSTPSVGVTLFADSHETIDELLKRADLALYQAKAAGRNTLRFFDPKMQVVVANRAALEGDLRAAVQNRQFLLHYQVQVEGEGQLTGAEVLLRWQHPERGMVSPAEFIPLAEETGQILPLGHWVLHTACSQLALWATQPKFEKLSIAVNVSVRQFRQPNFVDEVLSILDLTQANPHRLKLELTESLMVADVEDIIAKMTALKASGVGFSLDDFGTGYSSLSYLKRLPLDQLKIDQGFVRDILTDPNDAAIAKMVIALAESLGLAVIAEGVEIDAQREFLASQGCHAYQGYLFSRPLPISEFEALVKRS